MTCVFDVEALQPSYRWGNWQTDWQCPIQNGSARSGAHMASEGNACVDFTTCVVADHSWAENFEVPLKIDRKNVYLLSRAPEATWHKMPARNFFGVPLHFSVVPAHLRGHYKIGWGLKHPILGKLDETIDGWQLSGRIATKSRPPGRQYATVEACSRQKCYRGHSPHTISASCRDHCVQKNIR